MAELTPLEAVTTHDRGIEILVELAKNGQIDPWHIDVVDVTDKYLKTLDVTKEADLRLSGRCLFYAAVLLRLKGEALAEEEEAEEMIIRPAVHVLDQAIARRTSAKQPRTRPTTLVELIAELQRLEEQERERAMSSDNAMRRHRATPEEQRQAVIQMTHEEDLEGDIDRLTILLSEWLTSTGTVLLSDVLAQCPDPRGAFLALLFLDSRGKIALEQPAFYDEILILPEELHAQERAA